MEWALILNRNPIPRLEMESGERVEFGRRRGVGGELKRGESGVKKGSGDGDCVDEKSGGVEGGNWAGEIPA